MVTEKELVAEGAAKYAFTAPQNKYKKTKQIVRKDLPLKKAFHK